MYKRRLRGRARCGVVFGATLRCSAWRRAASIIFHRTGGAGVIAGLDLSTNRALMVGAFAWMGATQIAYALAQLAVPLRYRKLTPLFLFLALIERGLAAIAGWLTKTSARGHHPPEHYGVLVGVPLIAVFLVFSLRSPPSR